MHWENVEFINNIGVLSSGIHIDASHLLFENCMFNNNTAREYGVIYSENLEHDGGDAAAIHVIIVYLKII